MKPILFREDETAFTSNGLGRIDALKCEVTEERNGQFELEMDVSIDDRHFQDIREGRILLARHDDTVDKQPFEIYQISKPLNGRVTVYAHHISYRTEKITVTPFNAQQGIAAAMTAIQSHCVGTNPFVLWTDKTTTGKFTMEKPATLRSLLGGTSGSLLDVYGTGEYEWDRFTIKLHASRGRETGVVLRYGKNITELKKTSDVSSVWTGIVPFWFGVSEESLGEDELVMLPEVVLYSSAAADYAYTMIVPLDLSGNFEGKPTEAQLRTAAQNYVDNNEITDIPTSIEVSFVAAWQTDEYKNVAPLERLSLCDTITIRHTRLGVDSKAKIIKTVFDVLKEKYVSMTVGEARTNLATEISGGLQASVDDIRRTMATKQRVASVVNAKVDEMTTKITGGDGGHIVIQKDANENPREILAMNTDDVDTATNVLRINMNGIGFSSTGINGPYRSAWTLDGQFVADFITAGTLSANRIAGGVLSDLSGDNTWDLTTGAISFENLSWTASHSSMTADGHLTCEGAEISGEFVTTGQEDGYDTKITLENGTLSLDGKLSGTKRLGFNISLGNDANGQKSVLLGADIGTSLIIRSYNDYHDTTIWMDTSQLTLDARNGNNGMINLWSSGIYLNSNALYVNGLSNRGYSGAFWAVDQSISGNHWLTFINGILVGVS